jgi:putative glutamine amidotransferase
MARSAIRSPTRPGPTATTDDGLVQAIESDGDGYLVGVQWHPEENAEDRRLFAGLVAEASVYANRSVGKVGA